MLCILLLVRGGGTKRLVGQVTPPPLKLGGQISVFKKKITIIFSYSLAFDPINIKFIYYDPSQKYFLALMLLLVMSIMRE